MQQGGLEDRDVVDATGRGEDRRDFDRMVDVGRLVISLAALVTVLVRGKGEGAQQGRGCGGCRQMGMLLERDWLNVEVGSAAHDPRDGDHRHQCRHDH